MRKGNGSVK